MTLSRYTNQRVALLTQHGKEKIIYPEFNRALGVDVVVAQGFDTDQLGTFSREIDRTLSPLECARKKALLACELTGLDYGLGSEGSFGSGPFGSFVPWHEELLVFVDHANNIEVSAIASNPSFHLHLQCKNIDDVIDFLNEAEAGQHLIMRPDHESHRLVFKALQNVEEVSDAFDTCLANSSNGVVLVEYDLRAHLSPQRMMRIGEAAQQLTQRLTSLCPKCEAVNFWVKEVVPGLPCAACQLPTNQTHYLLKRCDVCGCEERQSVNKEKADPYYCSYCNP